MPAVVPEWGNYAFAEKQTAGNSKIDGFVDACCYFLLFQDVFKMLRFHVSFRGCIASKMHFWGAGKVGEGGLGKFYCEVQRLETIQMEVGVIPLFTVIDVFTNIILISDRYYS